MDDLQLRYERLQGQYRAVVEECDRYKKMFDNLAMHVRPQEMMALVCDGRCGQAIVGHSEEVMLDEARRRSWTISVDGQHHCNSCAAKAK